METANGWVPQEPELGWDIKCLTTEGRGPAVTTGKTQKRPPGTPKKHQVRPPSPAGAANLVCGPTMLTCWSHFQDWFSLPQDTEVMLVIPLTNISYRITGSKKMEWACLWYKRHSHYSWICQQQVLALQTDWDWIAFSNSEELSKLNFHVAFFLPR